MKTTFDILSVAARALTYDYVKAYPERPAPHNLSASQSEAARSESVGPEAAPALCSSSFITDATGYTVQHLQHLPFGETFVDQQNCYDTRYAFSAKEKPACRNASSGWDDEKTYLCFGYSDNDPMIHNHVNSTNGPSDSDLAAGQPYGKMKYDIMVNKTQVWFYNRGKDIMSVAISGNKMFAR